MLPADELKANYDKVVTRDNLAAALDHLTVVLGAFGGLDDSILTNRERYNADLTFIPVKLLPVEVAALELILEASPFRQETNAPDVIPNDLYRLKVCLKLTEVLLKGALDLSASMPKDRLGAVVELIKKFAPEGYDSDSIFEG